MQRGAPWDALAEICGIVENGGRLGTQNKIYSMEILSVENLFCAANKSGRIILSRRKGFAVCIR